MILFRYRFLLVFLLGGISTAMAQLNPDHICKVEQGRLIFILDSKWSEKDRKKVREWFDLDSSVMAAAFALRPVVSDSGRVWKVRKLDGTRVELSREPTLQSRKSGEKVILLDDRWLGAPPENTQEEPPFGINRAPAKIIFQAGKDRVRIFLPGHRNSRRIFVAGSFNGWSTLQNPMIRTDSGWVATVKVKPGRYLYKFIIDGKWAPDPNNKLKEGDSYKGFSNVFYCYNHTFSLSGYSSARKVFLAGSFNNWDPAGLPMTRSGGRWTLSLYLREGTYAYKFIADKNWITDPANPVKRSDGQGNFNSFMSIGDTLFFELKGYNHAKKVVVTGGFNGWNPVELEMSRTPSGWKLPYVLPPGRYEYKFVVDGQWITDPANPLYTGSGKYRNSYLAVKPNFWFRLDQHSDADVVVVTGSFNQWSQKDYRMELRQGTWWFPVYLKPGKYTYKFIVDGNWILDPANNLWEDNEYGTGNSVLWIEP